MPAARLKRHPTTLAGIRPLLHPGPDRRRSIRSRQMRHPPIVDGDRFGDRWRAKWTQLRATQTAHRAEEHSEDTRFAGLWSRRPRVRVPSLTPQKSPQSATFAITGLSGPRRRGQYGDRCACIYRRPCAGDVDRVIEELRDLAHGIYPALLTSFGLATALVSAGVQSGRPVTVQASGVRRCRREVEIAVYFRALPRLTTRPNTPDRCRSRLPSPTPVARWSSRSATQARGVTRPRRSSARDRAHARPHRQRRRHARS